jgi:hypothetical protein
MRVKIFDLKLEMIREGIKMIDFLENNFKVNYYSPYLDVNRVMLIEERHLCNPFNLAYEAYGDTNQAEVILKFNQITNPFSMQLNDILIIPELTSVERFYRKSKVDDKIILDTKSIFIDPERASQKDLNRLEQLKRIAEKKKNGSASPKPTNLLRPGEVPFVSDGNVITLAPNSSRPRNT